MIGGTALTCMRASRLAFGEMFRKGTAAIPNRDGLYVFCAAPSISCSAGSSSGCRNA